MIISHPSFRIFFGSFLLVCAWAHAEEALLYVSTETAISSGVVVSVPMAAPVEPYECPLAKCVVLSKFGGRTVPGKGVSEKHEGICLRVTPGQTVRADRSGKVIFAGFSKAYVSRADKRDQQRLVIIHHADGQSTRYVHLNTLQVKPPQEVKAGDVIGTASESDEWSEPVLHLEIRSANGTPLNPEKFLKVSKK